MKIVPFKKPVSKNELVTIPEIVDDQVHRGTYLPESGSHIDAFAEVRETRELYIMEETWQNEYGSGYKSVKMSATERTVRSSGIPKGTQKDAKALPVPKKN